MNCYLHPENQAVAQCEQCGHGICKNCSDLYGSMCYECTEKSAMANLNEAVAFKEKAVRARKGMVTGSIVGGVTGLLIAIITAISIVSRRYGPPQSAGDIIAMFTVIPVIFLLMSACIGSSIVTVLMGIFRAVKKTIPFLFTGTGLFVGIIAIATIGTPIVVALAAATPIVTTVRFFRQKKQMAKGDAMIEESNRALAALHEHHETSVNA